MTIRSEAPRLRLGLLNQQPTSWHGELANGANYPAYLESKRSFLVRDLWKSAQAVRIGC